MSILLAEDNPVTRMIAKHMLEFEGHEVQEATNGRQAVELCRRYSFDLVLMDVDMPEMNGLDATRAIRAIGDHTLGLPVIGITAYHASGEQDRCLRAGMNDILDKPFRAEELLAKLSCWSNGKTAAEESAAVKNNFRTV